MKKKMVFGAILTILLVLQAQMVFADYNDDFLKEVGKNDFKAMERILQRRANQMDLPRCTYWVLNGTNGLSPSNIIPVLELLRKYGAEFRSSYLITGAAGVTSIPPVTAILGNKGLSDTVLFDVIQYLLRNGADPNREYVLGGTFLPPALGSVLEKPQLFSLLIENGADINIRLKDDETFLIRASKNDNFRQLQILIQRGANVNLRAKDGSTAASIAYDRGNMEIYDYLMTNGAREFEPRQTAAQPQVPTQSTTIIVQPSAPVQSAQVQPTQSTPTPPRLTSGFYWEKSVSGSRINLNMVHPSTTGTAFHTINNANQSQGNFSMDGGQLIINWFSGPLNGVRSVYRIDSSRQFSGSGEVWTQ
jgi:hypothetical protein